MKTFLAVVFLTSDPQTLLIRPLTLSPEMVSWDVDLKVMHVQCIYLALILMTSSSLRRGGGMTMLSPCALASCDAQCMFTAYFQDLSLRGVSG